MIYDVIFFSLNYNYVIYCVIIYSNTIYVLFCVTGHLPPTVELNALAMKRGEPTVYTFRQAPPATLQHQFMPPNFNNFPRMYNPRIPYNRGVHTDLQGLYLVTLKVGEREFTGRGLTGQAARHDAASRALEQLRQLPLPEEIASVNNTNENGTLNGIDDPNAELKSPVSLVHETALKRGLSVSFEVVSESGKPHIRTFMTKCTVGDKVTVGEGSSKKVILCIFLPEKQQIYVISNTHASLSHHRCRRNVLPS